MRSHASVACGSTASECAATIEGNIRHFTQCMQTQGPSFGQFGHGQSLGCCSSRPSSLQQPLRSASHTSMSDCSPVQHSSLTLATGKPATKATGATSGRSATRLRATEIERTAGVIQSHFLGIDRDT